MTGARGELVSAWGPRLSIYTEYVDIERYPGGDVEGRIRDAFRAKYAGLTLDAIVALGPSPLSFLARWGRDLWPGVPIEHRGPEPDLRGSPNARHEAQAGAGMEVPGEGPGPGSHDSCSGRPRAHCPGRSGEHVRRVLRDGVQLQAVAASGRAPLRRGGHALARRGRACCRDCRPPRHRS